MLRASSTESKGTHIKPLDIIEYFLLSVLILALVYYMGEHYLRTYYEQSRESLNVTKEEIAPLVRKDSDSDNSLIDE